MSMPRLTLPLALLFLAACSGDDATNGDAAGDDDDTNVVGDDDDTSDTGYEYTSTITIDAQFLTVAGGFGYDETTNMVVPFEDPTYGPQPIQVAVIISDSSAEVQGITPSNSCTFTLSTNEPLPLVPVDDLGAWWGFEMPADAGIESECFVTLPEDFGDDPTAHITKWSWGFAVGPLDPTVAQQLEQQLGADWNATEPYIVGGGAFTTAFENVINDEGFLTGFGQAFAADADFAIETDPTGYAVQLYASDVWDGTSPARGVYTMATGTVGPASLITR